MAKIICPNAMTGTISKSAKSNWFQCTVGAHCPTCHGAGYTEAEVVEVEKVNEKFRMAVANADKNPMMAVLAFDQWIDSLKEAK